MKALLQQKGQAATECVITATFVLVPLFLIIPLLGKYIDIKHAAINQARYEAWEYTAWFGPNEAKKHILSDMPTTRSAGPKSWKKTREEGNLYFFSDPTAFDYGTDQLLFQLNPLWKDHRGDWLFTDGKSAVPHSWIIENETPDPTSGSGAKLIDELLDIISWVTNLFGELLEKVGVKAKFDAIYTKGYFTSKVNVEVRSLDQILPEFTLTGAKYHDAKPLQFAAKASVLSNDWSSGSSSKAISESKGLVVTSLLQPLSRPLNKVIDTLQRGFDILHKYTPIDVGLPHLPDFGYVQEDLVPLEYLRDDKGESVYQPIKNRVKHGLYFYEEKKK